MGLLSNNKMRFVTDMTKMNNFNYLKKNFGKGSHKDQKWGSLIAMSKNMPPVDMLNEYHKILHQATIEYPTK